MKPQHRGNIAMTPPRYVLQLSGQHIDTDHATCTGAQMAAILTTLQLQTADCQWFTADVEVHGAPRNLVLSTRDHVSRAGTTADLIAQLVQIPQVLSGVFLAISQDVVPSSWIQRFVTDDPPLRTLGPARFELRAFDTTYVEIYAHTWGDLEVLATRFNGQILPLPVSE